MKVMVVEDVSDSVSRWVWNDLIDILCNMNMQPTIGGFQFEICDGIVELDLRKRVADRFVNLETFVSLELKFLQIHLQEPGSALR